MKTPKPFPFNIGCDPEFTILFNDQAICAETLIKSLFKNEEIDNDLMGCKIKNAGVIGWDGATATAELRPSPAKTPKKLIENINILLKAFSEKTKIYSLTTMSDKAPIGGHIHLELKEELKDNHIKINNINKKLSAFYTPIMIGEDIVNLRSRMIRGYGNINDHREDPRENGATTIELRAPTAEWLTSPESATATIAYIATIYHEIINRPKNFNKAKEIFIQNDKQNKLLQDLAITKYLPLTKMLLNKIKKHVKSFEYYKEYKKEIDFILSPQKIINEKKKVDYDIMKGWKLVNTKQPNKKTLLSEKKIKDLSLKIDMDQVMNSIHIQYNEDTNVRDFVRAIKQRIITLNWKLENNYYIFGLKPKIPNYIVAEKNAGHCTGTEMIKTIRDYETIQSSFNRMNARFTNNPKTKNILIGIPYEERIKLNIKEFIELIYSLEKGKLPPIKIDKEKLIDDRNLPLSKSGEINQIYNSSENENPENMTLSPSDTEDAELTARRIRDEIEETTRQNAEEFHEEPNQSECNLTN